MKRVGLLGYPLGYTMSPVIHNAAYKAMGIDADYEAWVTPPEALAAAVQVLRQPDTFGASVTIPHKEAVIPYLDGLDETARRTNAVNPIVNLDGRLTGFNTDTYGFLRALAEGGFDAKGRRALLLGGGGAARAVAVGLADAGAAVTIAGRSLNRSLATTDNLRRIAGIDVEGLAWDNPAFAAACRDTDLIVNCTPLGTRGTAHADESPFR